MQTPVQGQDEPVTEAKIRRIVRAHLAKRHWTLATGGASGDVLQTMTRPLLLGKTVQNVTYIVHVSTATGSTSARHASGKHHRVYLLATDRVAVRHHGFGVHVRCDDFSADHADDSLCSCPHPDQR